MDVAELDGRLHDAEIDVESIRLDEGVLVLRGLLFELDHHKTVRRRFSLHIDEVDGYDLLDEAMVGILPVEEITQSQSGILFQGAIPVRLTIKTAAATCDLFTE